MARNPEEIPANSIAHPARERVVGAITKADLARSGIGGLSSERVASQPQQFAVQVTPFDAIPPEKLAGLTPSV